MAAHIAPGTPQGGTIESAVLRTKGLSNTLQSMTPHGRTDGRERYNDRPHLDDNIGKRKTPRSIKFAKIQSPPAQLRDGLLVSYVVHSIHFDMNGRRRASAMVPCHWHLAGLVGSALAALCASLIFRKSKEFGQHIVDLL